MKLTVLIHGLLAITSAAAFGGYSVDVRLDKSDGRAVTIRASMDRPGWLFFGFEIIGPDGNPLQGEGIFKHRMKPTIVGEIGAMYDANHGRVRHAESVVDRLALHNGSDEGIMLLNVHRTDPVSTIAAPCSFPLHSVNGQCS